jgi:hypothetical protein
MSPDIDSKPTNWKPRKRPTPAKSSMHIVGGKKSARHRQLNFDINTGRHRKKKHSVLSGATLWLLQLSTLWGPEKLGWLVPASKILFSLKCGKTH